MRIPHDRWLQYGISVPGKGWCLVYLPAVAVLVLGIFLAGCSRDASVTPADTGQPAMTSKNVLLVPPREMNSGGFTIEAKYDNIKSYPTGGGVFVVRLRHDENFSGTVNLSLAANNRLGAELDKKYVTAEDPIAEITVHPSSSIEIKTHIIHVKAVKSAHVETLDLEVGIMNWSGGQSGEAVQKHDEFIDWLHTEHPEFGNFSGRNWFCYATYPGILIVEHWTFLDADWEFRICWHVMIPPYDWSKMMLRRRGEWDPVFAAHRDTDGNIYEIPVSEYPTFGY